MTHAPLFHVSAMRVCAVWFDALPRVVSAVAWWSPFVHRGRVCAVKLCTTCLLVLLFLRRVGQCAVRVHDFNDVSPLLAGQCAVMRACVPCVRKLRALHLVLAYCVRTCAMVRVPRVPRHCASVVPPCCVCGVHHINRGARAGNQIGDAGGTALSKALESNTSVKSLNISSESLCWPRRRRRGRHPPRPPRVCAPPCVAQRVACMTATRGFVRVWCSVGGWSCVLLECVCRHVAASHDAQQFASHVFDVVYVRRCTGARI